MKKQVFLFLVLAALVAGGVFAQVEVRINDSLPISVDSATIDKSKGELKVTYSASERCGMVNFSFDVWYKDSKGETHDHHISNLETILWARKASTFTFKLPAEVASGFTRMQILVFKIFN